MFHGMKDFFGCDIQVQYIILFFIRHWFDISYFLRSALLLQLSSIFFKFLIHNAHKICKFVLIVRALFFCESFEILV